jgi:hypothetical protein
VQIFYGVMVAGDNSISPSGLEAQEARKASCKAARRTCRGRRAHQGSGADFLMVCRGVDSMPAQKLTPVGLLQVPRKINPGGARPHRWGPPSAAKPRYPAIGRAPESSTQDPRKINPGRVPRRSKN